MSPGQTGHITGQMGRVPGQTGRTPGVSRQNSLCLLVFFFPNKKDKKKDGQAQIGKPPRLKHPRLVALEIGGIAEIVSRYRAIRGH